MISTLIVLISSSFFARISSVNGVTYWPSCPSGANINFKSTDFDIRRAPITVLAGQTYSSGGLFAAHSAEECCYNCATQTNNKCTTWTYDGCGVCYLSSAT